jgi:hypothetical protein
MLRETEMPNVRWSLAVLMLWGMSGGAQAGAMVLAGTVATTQPVLASESDARTDWRVIARRRVADARDIDNTPVIDGRRYREVRVCAERNLVRVRSAGLKLSDGRDQRLLLPPALRAGKCTKPHRVLGGPQGIRGVRFEYEAVSIGYGSAEIVVFAR